MEDSTKISAIVPVGERFDATGSLAKDYLRALDQSSHDFELVYVLDGRNSALTEVLQEIAAQDARLRIFQLTKSFGEATALAAGLENTDGQIVLTLPAYYQVRATEISRLLDELGSCDMAIAVRWPRAVASKFEVIRRRLFHWLVAWVSRTSLQDLGCGARAFTRYS